MPQLLSDRHIAVAVNDLLTTHTDLRFYALRVAVHRGHVYIGGHVDSSAARRQVDKTVRGSARAVRIHNRVVVDPAACMLSDWSLQQAIEVELWWSADQHCDAVNVAVERGIATLTGTVPSWHTRLAAERRATRAGAHTVLNHLQVSEWGAAGQGQTSS